MLLNRGIVLVIVCLLSVLVFALIGIYPNYLMDLELNEKMNRFERFVL